MLRLCGCPPPRTSQARSGPTGKRARPPSEPQPPPPPPAMPFEPPTSGLGFAPPPPHGCMGLAGGLFDSTSGAAPGLPRVPSDFLTPLLQV
jgi:hypothetical protein